MNKEKQNFQSSQAYLRYAGMATQMGLIIVFFSFLGVYLDNYFATKKIFVLIGSLSGVGLALYIFIKQSTNEK